MWHVRSGYLTRYQTQAPCIDMAWSLKHWTAREVLTI